MLRDQADHKALKVQQALPGMLGFKVELALQELKDLRVQLVQQVIKVFKELKVLKVLLGQLILQVDRVVKVVEDRRVLEVRKEVPEQAENTV